MIVDAWIDRAIFAAIGIFGIIVTSVIEMRVVAQILQRESDGVGPRRV